VVKKGERKGRSNKIARTMKESAVENVTKEEEG